MKPTGVSDGAPQDGYMPEASARLYLRNLPGAERHLLEAGYSPREADLDEVAARVRDNLGRACAS